MIVLKWLTVVDALWKAIQIKFIVVMLINSNKVFLYRTQREDYWAALNKLYKPEPNFSLIWH